MSFDLDPVAVVRRPTLEPEPRRVLPVRVLRWARHWPWWVHMFWVAAAVSLMGAALGKSMTGSPTIDIQLRFESVKGVSLSPREFRIKDLPKDRPVELSATLTNKGDRPVVVHIDALNTAPPGVSVAWRIDGLNPSSASIAPNSSGKLVATITSSNIDSGGFTYKVLIRVQ